MDNYVEIRLHFGSLSQALIFNKEDTFAELQSRVRSGFPDMCFTITGLNNQLLSDPDTPITTIPKDVSITFADRDTNNQMDEEDDTTEQELGGKEEVVQTYCGLANQGATCYMNSLIQALFMTPEFRKLIYEIDFHALFKKHLTVKAAKLTAAKEKQGQLSAQDEELLKALLPLVERQEDTTQKTVFRFKHDLPQSLPETLQKEYDRYEANSIIRQLQHLFLGLQFSRGGALSTKPLTDSFGWSGTEAFEQHDSQELLRILLDAISTRLVGTAQEKAIERLYAGTEKSYVKCTSCGHESSHIEPFMDLSVAAKGFGEQRANRSIFECLAKYVMPETLEGTNAYKCEGCGKLTTALKGTSICKLPYILTLQVKRFDFDMETFERIKINSEIKYPSYLDMREFTEGNEAEVVKKYTGDADPELPYTFDASHNNSDKVIPDFNSASPGEGFYELFAVLIHSGSAYGGHYFSYIKDLDTKKWLTFNDSFVSECTMESLRSSYGTPNAPLSKYSGGCNFYLLFYRKISAAENMHYPKASSLSHELEFKHFAIHEAERLAMIEKKIEEETMTISVMYGDQTKDFKFHQSISYESVLNTVTKAFITDSLLQQEDVRLREYDTWNKKLLRPKDILPAAKVKDFCSHGQCFLLELSKNHVFPVWEPEQLKINVIIRKHGSEPPKTEEEKNLEEDFVNLDDNIETLITKYGESKINSWTDDSHLISIEANVPENITILELKKNILSLIPLEENYDLKHLLLFEENSFPSVYKPEIISEYEQSKLNGQYEISVTKEVTFGSKKFYCEYAEETIETMKKSFFLKRYALLKKVKKIILNIPKPLLEKCVLLTELQLIKKNKDEFYSISFNLYNDKYGKDIKQIVSNITGLNAADYRLYKCIGSTRNYINDTQKIYLFNNTDIFIESKVELQTDMKLYSIYPFKLRTDELPNKFEQPFNIPMNEKLLVKDAKKIILEEMKNRKALKEDVTENKVRLRKFISSTMFPSIVFADEKQLSALPTNKGNTDNIVIEIYDEEVAPLPSGYSLPFVAHWSTTKEEIKEIPLKNGATIGDLRKLIPNYFDVNEQQKQVLQNNTKENEIEKEKIQISPAVTSVFVNHEPSTFSRKEEHGKDDFMLSDLGFDCVHGLLFYMLPGEHISYGIITEESKPVTIVQETQDKSLRNQNNQNNSLKNSNNTECKTGFTHGVDNNIAAEHDKYGIDEMLSHNQDNKLHSQSDCYALRAKQEKDKYDNMHNDMLHHASSMPKKNKIEKSQDRSPEKPCNTSATKSKYSTSVYHRKEKSLIIKNDED